MQVMKETADRVQLSDVCLYRQGAAAAASATGEASHVATMRTIRQVKTVFLIFIAFVSCWTPYIVVVLYDTSDTLPLPVHLYRQRRPPSVRLQRAARHSVALVVHLYASMLAHLHASLNFAIYGLMNPPLTPDE